MRGSGLHQRIGSPVLYQGKIPDRYASSSRFELRSPPAASRPFGRRKARSTGGKAARSSSQGINARWHAGSEPLVGALADESTRHTRTSVAGRVGAQVVLVGVDDHRAADDAVTSHVQADAAHLSFVHG